MCIPHVPKSRDLEEVRDGPSREVRVGPIAVHETRPLTFQRCAEPTESKGRTSDVPHQTRAP